MGNILTYVQTELRRFSERPFGVVDSLVLAELAYVRFGSGVPGFQRLRRGVRLRDLYKAELMGALFPFLPAEERAAINSGKYPTSSQNRYALLAAAAMSPRFRDIRLRFYAEEQDDARTQQFAAVTFLLPGREAFIAFRGTDSSLTGWKEDFNMALISPIPSQESAAKYLAAVGRRLIFRRTLMTGGHSKGGNLAVYAAMTAAPSLQKRTAAVYNHDGPGFKTGVLDSPGYRAIEPRIVKILPQSSIVGMLLSDKDDYAVVESRRFGPMQHDAFSWEIKDGNFVYAEKLTGSSEYMNRTLKAWLESMPDAQRQALIEVLFQVLESAGADTVEDIVEGRIKSLRALLSQYRNLDAGTRKMIARLVRALLKLSVKNLRRERARKESAAPSPEN